MTEPVAPVDNYLEDRYGSAVSRRVDRRVFYAVGAFFAAILIAWAAWAGLSGDVGNLEFRNVGHEIVNADSVEITYEISAAPETRVACALQALSSSYAVVGWKIVEVPPSSERTRQFTDNLRTIAESTTGVVDRCWIIK